NRSVPEFEARLKEVISVETKKGHFLASDDASSPTSKKKKRTPSSVSSANTPEIPIKNLTPLMCQYCNKRGHSAATCFRIRDGLTSILPTTQPVAPQNPQQQHQQPQRNLIRGDRPGVPQNQVQNQPRGNIHNPRNGDNRQPRNFQFQRNWQPARNQQQVPSPPNNDA
ncbi:unnamed protein product, partial [Allacma fusca]